MDGFANAEEYVFLASAFETRIPQDDWLDRLELWEEIIFLVFIVDKIKQNLLLEGIDFSGLDIEFELYLFEPVIRRFQNIDLLILDKVNQLSFTQVVGLDEFDGFF